MSSIHIYPYVYKLIHKTTGQFYFGFRCANKFPSNEDLGSVYFSSSKTVEKIGFENFNYHVIAEFFDKSDARAFERDLIHENFNDPLILNKGWSGHGGNLSAESRKKISETLKKKFATGELIGSCAQRTDEQNKAHSMKLRGKPQSPESNAKRSAALKGRPVKGHPQTPETRDKISKSMASLRRRDLVLHDIFR